MHIVTVCGLGVGSSLIMKMTVENVVKDLGLKATVEHWDMGTIKSKSCDLIVTTEGFRKNFQDRDDVIFVTNIVDKVEMKQKFEEYLGK
ncbi:PTS sugar transporter subunit IIB [Erysipelothrix aquatica]|uniref:PTS sugar transporter subunit IIB n=1 Tax=Erysipelothrix aquatica TaxID=2683714 RepID=UPI001359580D|nr:PTS sugar transporter subunit IIB [Erysipelothrix aquatica]